MRFTPSVAIAVASHSDMRTSMYCAGNGHLTCGGVDQSLASNSSVGGSPHAPRMSVGPHCGMTIALRRGPERSTVTRRDRSVARSQGHAVVTVRRDVGYMSIRRVDPPRHGDKSQHTGAHGWRRLFSAASPHIQVAAAGESKHRTADRLPAARTRVRSEGVHDPSAGPTPALSPAKLQTGDGQEGAGRLWCWDQIHRAQPRC